MSCMIEYLHLLEVLFAEVFPLVWVSARLCQRFLLVIEQNFPEQLMNRVYILKSVINVFEEMIKSFFPGQGFVSESLYH